MDPVEEKHRGTHAGERGVLVVCPRDMRNSPEPRPERASHLLSSINSGEHELTIGRDANCAPKVIFTSVVPYPGDRIEQTRFWKASHKPHVHRCSGWRTGDDVPQSKSQRFARKNGGRALYKGDISHFCNQAKATHSDGRASAAGSIDSALEYGHSIDSMLIRQCGGYG